MIPKKGYTSYPKRRRSGDSGIQTCFRPRASASATWPICARPLPAVAYGIAHAAGLVASSSARHAACTCKARKGFRQGEALGARE